MRRKCRFCICRSCLKSCKCSNCKGKIKECKRYSGFEQMSIFDTPPEPKYQKAPRYPWIYYGISEERYRQLTEYIQSGRYASIASQAAHTANKDIAEYILLSVTKNMSYDALRIKWQLKEIEQMPCCRTDFYGYRRYFYHLFNEKIKEMGK